MVSKNQTNLEIYFKNEIEINNFFQIVAKLVVQLTEEKVIIWCTCLRINDLNKIFTEIFFKKIILISFTVKVSFLTRDREREFFIGLTFHHDHFGIGQEYTWRRYGTVR